MHGDNVVEKSGRMPWYQGSPLLYALETVYIGSDANHVDPRFPVQWVIRPNSDDHHDFRGFAGRVAGGVFKVGDEVLALPAGLRSRVKALHGLMDTPAEIFSPMSAVMTLEHEIDVSRGDMLVKPNNVPHTGRDLEAMICWFSATKLQPGGRYVVRHTTREAKCVLKEVRYRVDINTLHRVVGDREIGMNDIGRVHLRTAASLFYDAYKRNRNTGSFILIDELTNNTVAAGMILEPGGVEAVAGAELEMGGL
ncbi:MAG: hypothetical protein A3G75_00055 [Verrucomicrobia bacterium RIFCSPLOWO2_12_FULL_64_8]|nr:MAG: hypothetical protein A3G75_00055 [Verrucomicrobia bacterium RIFCSPLOWO2_12_FULL_64_8]